MYSIVTPEVCIAALATLAPEGWSFEDVQRKTHNVIRDSLREIQFAQKARKDGAKLVRLKVNRTKFTASYSTAMQGDIKNVKVKMLDLHDWLWDIHELTETWGEDSIESVTVPDRLADFAKAMFVAKEAKNKAPDAETVNA